MVIECRLAFSPTGRCLMGRPSCLAVAGGLSLRSIRKDLWSPPLTVYHLLGSLASPGRSAGVPCKPTSLHSPGRRTALIANLASKLSTAVCREPCLMRIPWRGSISTWPMHSMTLQSVRWYGCLLTLVRRTSASSGLGMESISVPCIGLATMRQTNGPSGQFKRTGFRSTFDRRSRICIRKF